MPSPKTIWMDGKLVPYEDATVHFMAPALHYGLSIFEGIRCYQTPEGPAVFRLRDHLQRFLESAHIFGLLDFPYSLEDLRQAVHDTISANELQHCYVRPLIYMGGGALGLNLDTKVVNVGIAVWEWGTYLGVEALDNGVRAMISSYTRLHPNVNMTKAKIAGNYVNSILAKTLALRAGFEECILLDTEGYVAECTGENVFMVKGGKLYTPPLASVLEGVTRDSIRILAGDKGYTVVEERMTRDQLYVADEVFITGTAAEVVAIRELDFRKIGDGTVGPITRSLQEAFFQTVSGTGDRSPDWLDYVRPERDSARLLSEASD